MSTSMNRRELFLLVLVSLFGLTTLALSLTVMQLTMPRASVILSSAVETIHPATSTPRPLEKIGERVTIEGVALTVNQVGTSNGTDSYHPQPGNTFFLVEITGENVVSNRMINFHSSYFQLLDAQGTRYQSSLVLKSPAPKTNLTIGQSTRGWLAFEVPADAHNLILEYAGLSGGTNNIRIALEK